MKNMPLTMHPWSPFSPHSHQLHLPHRPSMVHVFPGAFPALHVPAPVRMANQVCEEVNAISLASSDAQGRPSVRVLLLKGFDKRGFVFYTNYNSRKGRELLGTGHAAFSVYWEPLQRQVGTRRSGMGHTVWSGQGPLAHRQSQVSLAHTCETALVL